MPKRRRTKKQVASGGAIAGSIVGFGGRIGKPLPRKPKIILPFGKFPTGRRTIRRKVS